MKARGTTTPAECSHHHSGRVGVDTITTVEAPPPPPPPSPLQWQAQLPPPQWQEWRRSTTIITAGTLPPLQQQGQEDTVVPLWLNNDHY